MTDSILNTTKKVLGLPEGYDAFDVDVIMHINSVLADLNQLGIGPDAGFMITGPDEDWVDFLEDEMRLNAVKSYVYIRVRLLFDPPTNGFYLTSLEKQIEKMEWRLNVAREEMKYP